MKGVRFVLYFFLFFFFKAFRREGSGCAVASVSKFKTKEDRGIWSNEIK